MWQCSPAKRSEGSSRMRASTSSACPSIRPVASRILSTNANDSSRLALLLAAAGPAPESGGAEVRTADYVFSYGWPAAVEAVPDLRSRLMKDQEAVRRAFAEEAGQARQAAAADPGRPFRPYGLSVEWKVAADLPAWLSLSQSLSVFEGGAHPNTGFDSLVWDRRAGVERPPLDLFTSPEALDAAIRDPFCKALNRERAARRGEPIDPNSDGMFDQCVDPTASTVILGSSNKQQFDRIGILIAPYEAGPYAEGDYEITLPVTKAVLAAVKAASSQPSGAPV
jgi:hypothetical protein